VGRTGRAGNKGTAVTFVDWDDMPRWGLINKALGLSVPEPVETYSSSAHLFEELDIPEGTKGRLPRNKRVLAGVDAEVLEDLGETGKKNTRPSGRDGGRDGARDSARTGQSSSRDGSRGGSKDSGRDTRRSGGESGGRSGERRRRPAEAETSTRPAAEAPAKAASVPTEVDRATRARRRTRRRNGEVVAGEGQQGSTRSSNAEA
jgi:superfamily II DNA/RNA helicase